MLYSINMGDFFAAVDGGLTYTVKTNAVLYPSPANDNALYIGKVATLQQKFQELVTLINTIQNA